MSQERLSNLETEVAVLKATQEPLIEQMKENTKALTNLTKEISIQNKTYGDIKIDVEDHGERIRTLEDDKLLNQRLNRLTRAAGWLGFSVVATVIITATVPGFFEFISNALNK